MQNNTFSGLFVGQNIISLKTIDSTNNYLRDELSKSAPLPEGTVIMAEAQTAGRGQLTNTWHSEPGKNLTFSLLLRPGFINPADQFILNKCISVALNEVLQRILGNKAAIKWPNDIYFGSGKLGGMLIENIIRGSQWKYAIIGIGLNVNQEAFPDSLRNATSIAKILQSNYDLTILLSEICSHIEGWYLRLKSGHREEISRRYREKLYRLNEPHRYRVMKTGEEFTGTITNVTDEGILQLDHEGAQKDYSLKEIEFLNV
ncbi:biotin--[acetyl-CoA-carboxylase] ligase [Hufsiella ginkgonis]|uniref:Biotin--[acetyl-CoA-carboxylase] ligase n=1 Tax=Hufsiella ginkgonis TaxID=2695274 RepID=A0A7K1XVA7_9SPHI|nr:biotin--[acetyl-CoA-carboxylase] ligase [Hufsiella ginkgonis]MXV14912.1 biotin--[acetyl-CoA-carboxylase] ligase [Hufsiella ginkgonis]